SYRLDSAFERIFGADKRTHEISIDCCPPAIIRICGPYHTRIFVAWLVYGRFLSVPGERQNIARVHELLPPNRSSIVHNTNRSESSHVRLQSPVFVSQVWPALPVHRLSPARKSITHSHASLPARSSPPATNCAAC